MTRPHLLRDFLVGIGYLVVIASLIAVSILFYNKTFESTTDVSLRIGDASTALEKGADVEVRGVVVGTVRSISSDGEQALVKLALQPSQAKRLPSNVTAELLPKTLFGQRYVSLEIPSRPSPQHLASGDVIEPTAAGRATELEDVFTHLLPVLQAIKPAKLSETLGAIAASLRNEGGPLGHTIDTLSNYLRKFAPQVPQVVDDISRFAKVAKTYALSSPDLVKALRNFTTSSQTLVQERGQFVSLLQTVTSASQRLTDFARTNSQNVITLSRDSLPTLQVLAKYSSEFPCLSRALVQFIPVMNSALGAGTSQPGLHMTMQVLPARSPYSAGSNPPSFGDNSGPSCPGAAGSTTGTALGTLSSAAGLGTQNSPQENEVIAELMASSAGTSPQDYPHWGSLLLGPVLRGSAVTVR